MTQHFYVDSNGNYLGSYDGPDDAIPEMFFGANKAPYAPDNASQIWDGEKYLDAPDRVPVSVTSRQFKMQLVLSGLKSAVDAWVSEQPEVVQVAYEYSSNFVREEPMMQAGFTAMGFSQQELNDFFVAAYKL